MCVSFKPSLRQKQCLPPGIWPPAPFSWKVWSSHGVSLINSLIKPQASWTCSCFNLTFYYFRFLRIQRTVAVCFLKKIHPSSYFSWIPDLNTSAAAYHSRTLPGTEDRRRKGGWRVEGGVIAWKERDVTAFKGSQPSRIHNAIQLTIKQDGKLSGPHPGKVNQSRCIWNLISLWRHLIVTSFPSVDKTQGTLWKALYTYHVHEVFTA